MYYDFSIKITPCIIKFDSFFLCFFYAKLLHKHSKVEVTFTQCYHRYYIVSLVPPWSGNGVLPELQKY